MAQRTLFFFFLFCFPCLFWQPMNYSAYPALKPKRMNCIKNLQPVTILKIICCVSFSSPWLSSVCLSSLNKATQVINMFINILKVDGIQRVFLYDWFAVRNVNLSHIAGGEQFIRQGWKLAPLSPQNASRRENKSNAVGHRARRI